jgi:hypothetical protein
MMTLFGCVLIIYYLSDNVATDKFAKRIYS